MAMQPAEQQDQVYSTRRGLEACRREDWEQGLQLLGGLVNGRSSLEAPSVVYSYLGYGLALKEKKYREGLAMCHFAINADICEPENYFNCARTYLLTGKRSEAVGMLNRGMALEPDDKKLVALRLSLGVRKPPVLGFLSRDNLLNRILGRVRHDFRSDSAAQR